MGKDSQERRGADGQVGGRDMLEKTLGGGDGGGISRLHNGN